VVGLELHLGQASLSGDQVDNPQLANHAGVTRSASAGNSGCSCTCKGFYHRASITLLLINAVRVLLLSCKAYSIEMRGSLIVYRQARYQPCEIGSCGLGNLFGAAVAIESFSSCRWNLKKER
jgi:hypothetical protein